MPPTLHARGGKIGGYVEFDRDAAATFEHGGNAILYAGGADGQLRFVSDGISEIASFASGLELNIGQHGTGRHPHALDADIDELALWSRALSREEITRLYQGGAGQRVTVLIPEPGMAHLLLCALGSLILLIKLGSGHTHSKCER